MSSEPKISVLFVCLGNICRSPMAQAVFTHLVTLNGLEDRFETIASAGTAGYHIGDKPDSRTISTCKKNGVPVNSFAQQVKSSDFDNFDYILAMDSSNLRNLIQIKPRQSTATVKLFGEFGDGKIVKDPYYGGIEGFEYDFKQCVDYSLGLLKSLGFNPTKSID
ncbi:hypothetical protein MJO28_005495 [Puccinia striiformis f. sp. tritici]|uniref:Phosphotyrosine protein phosphatase I domain-containing protein n=2 Tax=Puccinia striiformis f. sp. tritici TaxID=168172 RepID=A0A0L0VLY7_9BASI|nr:hypothetical protein Pst134EA_009626 [Puccinia striiformis f. sp. tritici]KNE99994.1 hypothetical protein PSTG_06846 [Puccinia striiformis f. sp. tritici PST-78]KAH9458426.1 hypothetical protein Pst134EB_010726 [Puccinia striiformis f. sp. tritici]KAH9469101.1 hypothetical protein Pst134EA_009626 [Puccinia striiformis f. sp. tritici]KAI7955095.1 hypothetical protein MJO28_005495 [Puccinia striiformis f. sp. tritici]KAI7960469.1 hypothetical protein MJO29_005537 [Puccinia striiformis f. sp. 